MHAVHNEFNVLIDEAIHQHFIIESPDEAVMEVLAKAQAHVNQLWHDAHLPKFIQFGKDGKGEHSHAANGPTVKKVLRHKTLLIETIEYLRTHVYPLVDAGSLKKADKTPNESGEDKAAGKKAGKKSTAKTSKKPKQKKQRGVSFDDLSDSEDDGAVDDDQGHDEDEEEVEVPELNMSKTPHQQQSDKSEGQADLPNYTQLPQATTAERVGLAFAAFIDFYDYLHSDHNRKASEITQEERATKATRATQLALDMQRATLALVGTHRRRTYAHDLVYGMHQLYSMFGRPWNAATEGSEHAHQDMKNFFLHLTCHSTKHKHGDMHQVLELLTVKQELLRNLSHLLPCSEYAAMRAGAVLATAATTKSGPKGLKMYVEGDAKMQAVSQQLVETFAPQKAAAHASLSSSAKPAAKRRRR